MPGQGDVISRTNARYVEVALELRQRLTRRLERLEARSWKPEACGKLSESYRRQISEVEDAVRRHLI